jgi:hypothetical protein
MDHVSQSSSVTTIGTDIGKNSFHFFGLDGCFRSYLAVQDRPDFGLLSGVQRKKMVGKPAFEFGLPVLEVQLP